MLPNAGQPPTSLSTTPPSAEGWRLEHSYAALPELFHSPVSPTPVAAPRIVVLNRSLATELGLAPSAWTEEAAAAWFSGNRPPPGARPLAQAYAGHQYGHFTTLGDGRAILLGEQIAPSGARFDVQLKGSGPTPYSRRGDGRAALGPMLREHLISEAMHALGIPTTRSLAVTATGETVYRETELPGAVLTRVASSHVRVGTFQWAAARGGPDSVRLLTDYTLRRHYPDRIDSTNPALALLEAVIERQAALLARWMLVGFVHGVMNTDNMALSGETIDYGPCAFMDAYDPATVFSSIDSGGRYAYGNQPGIAQWNLARLAETLLPLLDEDKTRAIATATAALEHFAERYQQHWLEGMRRKLGLFDAHDSDLALAESLLELMHVHGLDFTNTFAELASGVPLLAPEKRQALHTAEFRLWRETWETRRKLQTQSREESIALQRAHCPAFIPRNHLVEQALSAAIADNLGVMERLLNVLATPFDHSRSLPDYQVPAGDSGVGYRTFCGT